MNKQIARAIRFSPSRRELSSLLILSDLGTRHQKKKMIKSRLPISISLLCDQLEQFMSLGENRDRRLLLVMEKYPQMFLIAHIKMVKGLVICLDFLTNKTLQEAEHMVSKFMGKLSLNEIISLFPSSGGGQLTLEERRLSSHSTSTSASENFSPPLAVARKGRSTSTPSPASTPTKRSGSLSPFTPKKKGKPDESAEVSEIDIDARSFTKTFKEHLQRRISEASEISMEEDDSSICSFNLQKAYHNESAEKGRLNNLLTQIDGAKKLCTLLLGVNSLSYRVYMKKVHMVVGRKPYDNLLTFGDETYLDEEDATGFGSPYNLHPEEGVFNLVGDKIPYTLEKTLPHSSEEVVMERIRGRSKRRDRSPQLEDETQQPVQDQARSESPDLGGTLMTTGAMVHQPPPMSDSGVARQFSFKDKESMTHDQRTFVIRKTGRAPLEELDRIDVDRHIHEWQPHIIPHSSPVESEIIRHPHQLYFQTAAKYPSDEEYTPISPIHPPSDFRHLYPDAFSLGTRHPPFSQRIQQLQWSTSEQDEIAEYTEIKDNETMPISVKPPTGPTFQVYHDSQEMETVFPSVAPLPEQVQAQPDPRITANEDSESAPINSEVKLKKKVTDVELFDEVIADMRETGEEIALKIEDISWFQKEDQELPKKKVLPPRKKDLVKSVADRFLKNQTEWDTLLYNELPVMGKGFVETTAGSLSVDSMEIDEEPEQRIATFLAEIPDKDRAQVAALVDQVAKTTGPPSRIGGEESAVNLSGTFASEEPRGLEEWWFQGFEPNVESRLKIDRSTYDKKLEKPFISSEFLPRRAPIVSVPARSLYPRWWEQKEEEIQHPAPFGDLFGRDFPIPEQELQEPEPLKNLLDLAMGRAPTSGGVTPQPMMSSVSTTTLLQSIVTPSIAATTSSARLQLLSATNLLDGSIQCLSTPMTSGPRLLDTPSIQVPPPTGLEAVCEIEEALEVVVEPAQVLEEMINELGPIGPVPQDTEGAPAALEEPMELPWRLRRRRQLTYTNGSEDGPPTRRRRRRVRRPRALPTVDECPPPVEQLGEDNIQDTLQGTAQRTELDELIFDEESVIAFIKEKVHGQHIELRFSDCCIPGVSGRRTAATFFSSLLSLCSKGVLSLRQTTFSGDPREIFIEGLDNTIFGLE